MATALKWLQILDDEATIRAVMLGESDLPAFSGRTDSRDHAFYQLLVAALDLYQGEFEAAGQILTGLELRQHPFWCTQLVSMWHEIETGEPDQALQKIATWMDKHRLTSSRMESVFHPLSALDRRMARRWAPVLYCYGASLLTDWPEETLARTRLYREAAAAAGVSEHLLTRLDYLLRFSRARQEKSVGLIVAAAREWYDRCQQDPTLGDGTEYILEAVVALEFDERFEEALDWLQRGLDKDPGLYDLILVKARILKRIGEIKACLDTCNRLISEYPDDFSGYCLRSNTYFLMGWYDRAMADARKAVEVAPDNPNSLMARAFVQMQIGNFEAALDDFERTLHHDPQRYDALRGQGKCLSMLGRDYEALVSFTALRRTYPDDPDLYYELADVLFSAGYLEDCEKTCRKCLELDAEYANAYVILAMIAMRRNDDDKASRLLHRAIRMEPDNPFALNELAYLNHLQGDDDMAIELINRALEEAPDYADALCNKGVILYFRSEFDQSAAAFDETLQLVPDHVAALVGKGNTLTQLCEFDDAQICYDRALALDPRNADACHGKAILYRMLGLDDEVRRWQERAYSLDHDDDFE